MPHLARRTLPLSLTLALSSLAPLALSLALAPSAHAADAAGACKFVPVAELPIRLDGPAMEPLVDGSIDGAPAAMLIATGSTRSTLIMSAAEKRGLPLVQEGRGARGKGGGSGGYGSALKDFAVGPFHSGPAKLPVIGEPGFAPGYDALVGAEFLFQADMELSLPNKHIKFFRPDGCADTFLAYWDKDATEVPYARASVRGQTPRFEIDINGQKFEAVLGTYSARSSIDAAAAARAGVRTDVAGITRAVAAAKPSAGLDAGERWEASFDSVTIGGEMIKHATLQITPTLPNAKAQPDVILGRDFLRAHRVLFAASQQRLYLSYTGGEVFDKPAPAAAAAP